MSDPDALYQLLPAIFRLRDLDQGLQLRALLRAAGVQADDVADATGRLYENWFIETCDEDVVPRLAALVGLSLPAAAGAGAGQRRQEVANAIADRRRKGSFSVLERLAADATGWPARAVELAGLLLATPTVRLPELGGRALPDTRDADAPGVLGTALSDAAPLADVRRLSSHRTPGDASPNGVAVWLWRLAAEAVRRAPAASTDEAGRYAFDQLGRDMPLAVAPTPRRAGAAPAGDLDVPAAITRAALALRPEDYYGPGRSLCVYRGDEPIPRSEILVADLGGERHAPTPPGRVSIDPERGRIAFPARHPPEEPVMVTYAHLGIAAIGGGGYRRPPRPHRHVYGVAADGTRPYHTVNEALEAWREAEHPSCHAVVEVGDDGVYEERFDVELAAGERLEIRAAQGRRPILIPQSRADRPDQFRVHGACEEPSEPAPALVLDGVWVAGYPLELTGRLSRVELTHCTLVPAAGLARLEGRHDRRAPSLVVRAAPCPISIAASVVGRVLVEGREAGYDPIPLHVGDSVLDASDLDAPAVVGANGRRAWAALTLRRVTVLGGLDVESVDRVEDSIVVGALDCERRQTGAVRFSYVGPGSRTPRRTSCQPDDAIAAALAGGAAEHAAALETARLVPRFDATRFGAAAYARLAPDVAPELARGAHDEGELGAYHDLWHALRVADLRARLQEFAPVGTDIDIRFAT
jgi:hypothetical protein